MLHPLGQLLLHRQYPVVTLLETREDTSALTTYTFTDVNIGSTGTKPSITNEALTTHVQVRSGSTTGLAVVIHAEDALATFGVSSVTIGGVAGTERPDRGGGTNPINTALYSWQTTALEGLANTDIVVTMSEAVTGCAIGVLLINNIGVFAGLTSGSTTSTGVMATAPTSGDTIDRNPGMIIASTCATGGGTEQVAFFIGEAGTSSRTQVVSPTLLYEKSNANFDYAAAWTYAPGYGGGLSTESFACNVSWSGAGAGDMVLWVFA